MKKLSFVLLIVVSAVSFFIVGCQKDVAATYSTTSIDGSKMTRSVDSKPIQTFAELNADVKIEDGVLVFATFKDFDKTINFLRDTSLPRSVKRQEIKQWEESFPTFVSVYKYYETTKQELLADSLNPNGFSNAKAKYRDKVHFLADETIEPMVNNGDIYGRIISEKGQYKVGKIIIQYYKDKVISISDGNLDKLSVAMRNLETDKAQGVYVHDLFLGQKNPNDVQLRSIISPTCSNSCPVSFDQSIVKSMPNGETYRLTANYDILDNGWVAGWQQDAARLIDVSININIYQQRKRWWGFTASYSTGFDWGISWGLSLSLVSPDGLTVVGPPPTCCDEGVGKPAGGQEWFQASELNHTITIWLFNSGSMSTADREAFFDMQQLFCVRRIGLTASSRHVDANGNRSLTIPPFYCQQ
jgi:hypothetical protein